MRALPSFLRQQHAEAVVATRCINPGELAVGAALDGDVVCGDGSLLARRGHRVASDKQLAQLLRRGLWWSADAPAVAPAVAAPPSVLRLLNAAAARLHLVLAAIAAGTERDALATLDGIAADIEAALALQCDVALACILHNQDACPYPVRHCVDSAVVAATLARAMAQPGAARRSVVLAALTMNVGMVALQARVHACATPLAPADAALVRAHPTRGVALLRAAGVTDADCLDAVLLHHELDDGSGYPAGVGGPLPLAARIVALADRYCARVSARGDRQPMLPNAALRDILREKTSAADAELAAVFIRALGTYPIGTVVRLLNGEIGVVTHKGASSTCPIVEAVVGPRGAPLDVHIRRDTGQASLAIREVLHAGQAALGLRLDQLWGTLASA